VIANQPVGPWGARPVPLAHATGVRTAPGKTTQEAAPPFGSRQAGPDLAVLRGQAGAGRRAEVLAALPGESRRIVVVSVGGGAGRSVLTAGVALALARHRSWPVAVVDGAGEPFGALPARLGLPTGPTIVEALAVLDRVSAGTQLGLYVRRTGAEPAGVHLLAAPSLDQRRVDAAELERALTRLGELYPTVLVDCPAGVTGRRQRAALSGASGVLVAAHARADDLRRGGRAVDLIRRALPRVPVVGVVVAARPGRWSRTAAAAEPVFAAGCAAVIRLAWDVSLAEGASLSEVSPRTLATLEEVAATVLVAAPSGVQRRSGS
jgi:MinD-like ATPase involved in chromosome partitioning or flagellar assembly